MKMLRNDTYRSLFRRLPAAGIAGVLLMLAMLAGCSRAPQTFADSLRNMDADAAVKRSMEHIDSIAMHDPASLPKEVREVCEMLYARGFHHAATDVAVYPYGIDREQSPDIAERLLRATLLPGKPAPEIVGLGKPDKKPEHTLVFFYESTCRSCQGMIDFMKKRYPEFQKAGIRIVTISSDTDKKRFGEYSERFPWPDKLCDFKKYDGPNFVNYGVAATPTTFLIDKNGRVVEQYAAPQQVYDEIIGR